MSSPMDRREFLQKSLTGAGLTLAFCMAGFPASAGGTAKEVSAAGSFVPNAWLRIFPDDTVTILVSRSEMGQGVFTSMAMIVADELEADWRKVKVEASPTLPAYVDPVLGVQLTGGSMSVRNMFDPLSKAGATARHMLLRAAAEEWKVPVDECQAVQGTVKHQKSGRVLTYGALCSRAAKLPVPKDASVKKVEELRLVGTSVPRVDIRDKVNGAGLFGTDIFRPDMLYAVVARPPAFGAKAVSFKEDAARKVRGVRNVVRMERGIAVCADNLDAAWKGKDALEVKWDKGVMPDLDNQLLEKLFTEALEKKGLVATSKGDVDGALKKASKKLTSVYAFPYVAHVPMEPINCTAHVQKDRCDVWCPTQFQSLALRLAMKESGLKSQQVHVHSTYLGGGFGRRTEAVEVAEAVQISKAVGKAVKLIWTREEDIKYDFFRPASRHMIEAGLDRDGHVTTWRHKVATPSIAERAMPQMIENEIDPTSVQGLGDQDYDVPNLRVEWVKMDLPIPVGFWRSVGHSSHAFAVECFLDELAHASGKDPLAFRLNMLKDRPHPAGVLKMAAEKAGWDRPMPKGSGRGIAQHFSFGSHIAHVAEVSVGRSDGLVKVKRVVCAVDCGPVVNPDTIKAQMEGAIAMALSVALKERVEFSKGGVKSANLDDYELLTMSETPEIEVHIVKSDHKRGGIGEPGIPPLAPAVANAVFAATGVRLRSLPMSPSVIKKAFAGA